MLEWSVLIGCLVGGAISFCLGYFFGTKNGEYLFLSTAEIHRCKCGMLLRAYSPELSKHNISNCKACAKSTTTVRLVRDT